MKKDMTMDFKRAAEDFKTAAEELGRGVTHEEIAKESAVSVQSIQRAMLEEDSESYRYPPRFWKGDLAYLARERAAELVELADELEASAWAPATEEELEELGSMIFSELQVRTQPEDGLDIISLAEMEKRRADREKRREEELAELNELFRKGLEKGI